VGTSDRTASPRRWVRVISGLAVPAFALLLSGCGGGVGDVSGKITYKGKPVVYGSVSFVGADGIPRGARINPDGTYTVKDVGVGEAKITVVSDLPAQDTGGREKAERAKAERAKAGREEAPADLPAGAPKRGGGDERADTPEVVDPAIVKQWFPIPSEFADINKTKLRFTIRKGPNTYDIQLD
jgi:hypothetical protein